MNWTNWDWTEWMSVLNWTNIDKELSGCELNWLEQEVSSKVIKNEIEYTRIKLNEHRNWTEWRHIELIGYRNSIEWTQELNWINPTIKSAQKIALDLYTSHKQRPDQAMREICITTAWSAFSKPIIVVDFCQFSEHSSSTKKCKVINVTWFKCKTYSR